MIYVIADRHQKFTLWCRENGINPEVGAHQARYVNHMSQLLGLRGIQLVILDASWPAHLEQEARDYVLCHGGTVEYAYA